jgi:hypothetical protein
MSILGDLISKFKTDDLVEQMRILCDQVLEQESPQMEYIDLRPQGANIFICLQVQGPTNREIGFLALERDNEDLWIASYWTMLESKLKRAQLDEEYVGRPRKKKAHKIEDHRPEKILTAYAKLLKFYNGE